jgi:alpha-1,3-rhamnosyl/mannosyltransferase
LDPLIRKGQAIVLGQLKHQDSLALMASAVAFLYPSVHENCPNIVLEALSAGRVGVYADIAAVRELADDAAVYVPEPHPSTIAGALERAVFDLDARARISSRAATRAALFTWDRTTEQTAQVLERAFAAL